MRIVSMVPSATEILCALGLAKNIVGISHDCDYPADILNRPRVTGATLRSGLTSFEIDEKVRASEASGQSLYVIESKVLERLHPDLVITQEQCRVCAVDRNHTVCALASMTINTNWVSLSANGFAELYQDIRNVGSATARMQQAEQLVIQLAARLEFVAKQTAAEQPPRVFCLSWFDPLMSAGKWISQMVRLAGGDPRLGSEEAASSLIDIDRLREESPEVLFLMPCSFSQSRTADEWMPIRRRSPWRELPAVKKGRVFTLESSLFHRPGPRLVDGVELMATLIHPRRCSFAVEPNLWRKVA